MKLTAENVTKCFEDCLAGEERSDITVVEGIMRQYGFNNKALKKNEKDIYDMLCELPENFKMEVGGGWSFLQACVDKYGNQWTGLHAVMEQLFSLGLAIGKVKCLLPREMWGILPGGVPYYAVL